MSERGLVGGILYMCIWNRRGEIMHSINFDLSMVPEMRRYNVDQIHQILTDRLCGRIDLAVDTKHSFQPNGQLYGCTVQCMVFNEIGYMTCATPNFPLRICFQFMYMMNQEFQKYHLRDGEVNMYELAAFRKWVDDELRRYSTDPEVDKIRSAHHKIREITDKMHDNINAELQRGEKLEDLQNRAENLEGAAINFKKQSKDLRCKQCRQNMNITFMLIVTAIIVCCILSTFLGVSVYVLFKYVSTAIPGGATPSP